MNWTGGLRSDRNGGTLICGTRPQAGTAGTPPIPTDAARPGAPFFTQTDRNPDAVSTRNGGTLDVAPGRWLEPREPRPSHRMRPGRALITHQVH